jgi:NAD(P)-dependent dehydrogenase (short-subunit alcohol dehydrogenase family)
MSTIRNTIIITGANGNIGSALAARLAEEGSELLLLYHRSTDRLEKLKEGFSSSITLVKADLTDLSGLEKTLSKTITQNNINVQSLIHTAAMRSIDTSSLPQTSPDLWRKVIETNLFGTYHILKVVSPLLINAQKSSDNNDFRRIVLLGSDVSRIGLPFGTAYAAAKAATANIARSLSAELAGNRILINTVSPGPVKIDDSHFSEDYRRFRAQYYQDILQRTPLGSLAEISDVVSLCLFLISEENRYITGEEFFVTGGKI